MFWAAKGHGRRHNPVECGCIPGHCQRFSTWKCLGNPLKNKCFFHRCSIDLPISIDFPMVFTQEMGKIWENDRKSCGKSLNKMGDHGYFFGANHRTQKRGFLLGVFAWWFLRALDWMSSEENR